VPDGDHTAVLMPALQKMLMQADDGKLLRFPAWPRQGNLQFRLHPPHRTTVEGEYREEKSVRLKVDLPRRSEGLVLVGPVER